MNLSEVSLCPEKAITGAYTWSAIHVKIGTLISKDINQQVASMVGIFSGHCYTIRVVL